MKIELVPLEKMVYDGKDVFLGSKVEEVLDVLGEPESINESYSGNAWIYYYDEFCCEFNKDNELIAINFLYGHDGETRPYVYDVSVFDVPRMELIEILKKNNNDEITKDNENDDDSYTFKNISVAVWKDSDNDYDFEDDEEYDENSSYWTTFKIGKKDYFNK